MSDYTKVKAGLHRQANAFHPESLAATTSAEALAAITALEAEVARLRAVGSKAVDEWALWVHDQLDGTSSLAEAIAEVDATRAALIAPPVPSVALSARKIMRNADAVSTVNADGSVTFFDQSGNGNHYTFRPKENDGWDT